MFLLKIIQVAAALFVLLFNIFLYHSILMATLPTLLLYFLFNSMLLGIKHI
jgi:hypothetical protein